MAILTDAACTVQDKIVEADSFIKIVNADAVKETTKNLVALGNLKLADAYNTVYLSSVTWA